MSKEIVGKIHFFLTILLAFLMPLFQKGIPLVIVCLLLNFIVSLFFDSKIHLNKIGLFTYFILGFYGLHIIGLIYSNNLSYGLFDLEVKLSFLVLPLVYSITSIKFSQRDFVAILKSFLGGGLIAIIFLLVRTVWLYGMEANVFFGSKFSATMHLGYFALHLNFCVSIVIFFLLNELTALTTSNKKVLILVCLGIFIMGGVFLTTSRMGLIILAIQLVILFGILVFRLKYWKLGMGLLGIILMVMLFGNIGSSNLKPIMRFKVAINKVSSKDIDISSVESVTVRRLIWKSALGIISQHPFIGVGSGDVKDELLRSYARNGYSGALEKKLNAHNQFLQTTVAIGLLGGICLVVCLLYFLYIAVMHRSVLAFLVFLILVLGAFTESILEVQAGVVFFVFLSCIISYFAPFSKRCIEVNN